MDNIIFIGRKTAMNYVMACFTVVQAGHKKVLIKARGRAISRAVDVAEILRHRFMQGKIDIKDIIIGTETIDSKDRGTFSVSTVEIIMEVSESD